MHIHDASRQQAHLNTTPRLSNEKCDQVWENINSGGFTTNIIQKKIQKMFDQKCELVRIDLMDGLLRARQQILRVTSGTTKLLRSRATTNL